MPIRIRIDQFDVQKAETLRKKAEENVERTGLVRYGRNVEIVEEVVYRNEFEEDVAVLDVEQIAARVRGLRESLRYHQIQLKAAEAALKEVASGGNRRDRQDTVSGVRARSIEVEVRKVQPKGHRRGR